MADSSDDFSQVVASALGIESTDVASRLEGMTIEQMNDLINAVRDGDNTDIKTIMDSVSQDSADSVHPLLASPDGQAPANPNQPDENTNPDEEPTTEGVEQPEPYRFKLGDEVKVDGKDAVVRTPNGPNDTVGCVIDGVQRMIARDRVKPVTESILGAADLQTLARMRALAGLAPNPAQMPFQVCRVQTIDVPDAPVTQALSIAAATCVSSEPMADIKAAFAEIATKLPEIKQKDVKTVRKMVNNINNAVNEEKYSFFRSLNERRASRALSQAEVAAQVTKMGYSLRDATQMVEAYFDVLGDDGDDYAKLVVKQAIKSLNAARSRP